jgi:hypothetical protein
VDNVPPWAAELTPSEWRALLGAPGANRFARSRLKRKLAHWVVVMAHVKQLDPVLWHTVARQAANIKRADVFTVDALSAPLPNGHTEGEVTRRAGTGSTARPTDATAQ